MRSPKNGARGLGWLGGERGQTAAEYLGLMLVLAGVLAAIATADIGAEIRAGVQGQVCRTLSDGPCADGLGPERAEDGGGAEQRARSRARRGSGRQRQLSDATLDRGGGSVPGAVTLRPAAVPGQGPGGATTCFASVGSQCAPAPGGAVMPAPEGPSELERLGEDVLGFLKDAGSALAYEDPLDKLERERNLELLDDGLAFLEELNRQGAYLSPYPAGSLAGGQGSNLGNELLGISDLRRAIKASQRGDDAAAALHSAMAFPGLKLLKPTKEIGEEIAKRTGREATKAPRSAVDDLVGAACSFSGETLVLMADGSKKPISKIRVGDRVLATDPLTGLQTARKVTHVWVHRDRIVRLDVDGDLIATTENHPFWDATDQGWEPAERLDQGDKVLSADGRNVRVEAVRLQDSRERAAYNLTVEGVHTYHVGGLALLVHNICGPLTGPQARETLNHLGVDTRRVVGRIKGREPIYRLPDGRFITRDLDSHVPSGAFKVGRRPEDLLSRSTRDGTYGVGPNDDLVRVGP